MKLPKFKVFVQLDVFDKEGNLLSSRKQPGHSWTRNFYNWLFSQMAGSTGNDATWGAGYCNIKKTNGVLYKPDIIYAVQKSNWQGGAGVDTEGIVVGTGTDAESFEDYKLQTKVANGAGGGQLNYVASATVTEAWAPLDFVTTHIRYFNNNSGGAITINEVAIYLDMAANYPTCITRDKLGAGVAVPDTGQLKVTYTITLTYP